MKRIIFIGNSFVYYGNCVDPFGDRQNDDGYFYRLCKANCDDFTVTNATYGGHHLYDFLSDGCASPKLHQNGKNAGCEGIGYDLLGDFDLSSYDYVVLAESGDRYDNSAEHGSTVSNYYKIKQRFLDAGCNGKFVYCVHTYPYTKTKQYYDLAEAQISEIKAGGDLVVNWGELIYKIITDGMIVDGGMTYDKNSFIVCKSQSDGYHPNLLTGYITAQLIYSTITGKSAVGQNYRFCSEARDFSEFAEKYYTYENAKTNFAEIFASSAEMLELQKLCDLSVKKYK